MLNQQPENSKQMAQYGETDANTNGNECVEDNPDHENTLASDVLELSYPTSEEPVVKCDRIDIPHGKIVALAGPDGSSEDMLLKSLAKQFSSDSGSVYFDGKPISEYDNKAFARELGMLSQQYGLPTSLTVEDLVYHGWYPHRNFFEQVNNDDHEVVEHAIDFAGVGHTHNKQIGSLSGGRS